MNKCLGTPVRRRFFNNWNQMSKDYSSPIFSYFSAFNYLDTCKNATEEYLNGLHK